MADSIKINKLEIENVKRIKAVKIEPTKNGLTIVGGNNNQGKTSVLDSIAWALGGDRYKPSNASRDGSTIPPNLHIVMSNGLVVERKGKNSSLKVTDPNGNKGGQQLLNDFVEQLALDLPKFMEFSGKEKAQTLLKIIGVGDQLTALEQQEKELYNERLYAGRTAGVSIYESAKGLIKKADVQAARLDWEYDSGERAIHVDQRALKNKGGKTYLPRLKKRLYKGMNLEDGKDKELYKEYSPAMRDEAFRRGLEEYKREIEFNVGLAYGDLSDAQEVDKTATEVLASKTRKYNRVTAIQEKLEECLNGFVNALAFYNGSYMSGVEFTCEFNDSILADEESERQQDRQDVSMGVMSLVEYRMKWYNEDEATAKSKIPEQNQVME